MPVTEPFAEVEQVQDGIRAVLKALADAVTVIANLEDIPDTTKQGHIEREVGHARTQIRELRLQERLSLDQAAVQLEAAARLNGTPLWSETERTKMIGDPRRPDRVRDAMLGELVKANVVTAFAETPPPVLLHRLRLALRVNDFVTADAIRLIALRRVLATGTPVAGDKRDPESPLPRRYLLRTELGSAYVDYEEGLDALLDALAAFDEARLPVERRQARQLVESGRHRRRPLDVVRWAGDDALLKAVVERLGDV
ncbi:MAG: hypothetical protein FJX74_14305 [Armatimonadetes bacterium]|nr:hypothetical protein [Armatimonadota bacterium]